MPKRKIIQVATLAGTPDIPYKTGQPAAIYALCDDGTLWAMNVGNAWARVVSIPDTDYEAPDA
jgi:hypothetical protein